MNYRRIFLIVVIAAAVVTSGCTTFEQNGQTGEDNRSETGNTDDTSQQSQNQGENNTVFYTDSGFTPNTLEVSAGETVTWIDNSGKDMWVATDRHPTHTQYAGSSVQEHCQNGDQTSAAFDQCATGERFSFTFGKTGSWSYHNHVSAGDGGTVVVN